MSARSATTALLKILCAVELCWLRLNAGPQDGESFGAEALSFPWSCADRARSLGAQPRARACDVAQGCPQSFPGSSGADHDVARRRVAVGLCGIFRRLQEHDFGIQEHTVQHSFI
eukprot:10131847-Alexandrium_andersonii.AAC.1